MYDPITPGSSRFLRTSDMGAHRFVYDTLGNLVADTASGVYLQAYEYRNLLRHAVVEPTIFGEANSELLMWYDETGMRIRKYFAYAYYDDCPDDTVPPPGGGQSSALLGGSGMMTLGDGGGGGQCVYMTSDETLYLYDGGVLLCTFDKNDNVIEMFVNGPSGRIASYLYNRDDLLHYFLSDHLGSTRVLVHAPSGWLPNDGGLLGRKKPIAFTRLFRYY